MIIEAIKDSGAAEVVVLPNDKDSVRVAEIAARTVEEESQVRVAVIPSQAQVQGLAALAMHEPGRTFDQDVLQMTAAARHARHGAVTIAAKQAITMAGPCEPGDVLAGWGYYASELLRVEGATVPERLDLRQAAQRYFGTKVGTVEQCAARFGEYSRSTACTSGVLIVLA